MDGLARSYAAVKVGLHSSNVPAPDALRQRIHDACTSWVALYDRAVRLQTTAAATEVPVNAKMHDVLIEEDMEMIQPRSAPQLSAEVVAPPVDFDMEYDRFIKLDVEKITTSPVIIGDIRNIELAVSDIKIKRASVETTSSRLLKECETELSQLSVDDSTREQIEDKVSAIRNQSVNLVSKLDRRNRQLEDLLLQCRELNHLFDEFTQWIKPIEEDCEGHATQVAKASTVSAVDKLIGTNKKLESEVIPWEDKVNAMKQLSQSLGDHFSSDDSSDIKLTVSKLENRWTTVMMNITSQGKRLSSSLLSLSRFDTDLRDFLLWLTKAEVILMHHDEMTSANSTCTDSEQQWAKLEHSFWDLQADIENHKSMVKSLNITGNVVVQGQQQMTDGGGAGGVSSVENQLKELNDRWNSVNERSIELRSRLEVQLTPSAEMLQTLNDHINWLKKINADISDKMELVGDKTQLTMQLEHSQTVRDTLDSKRTSVEGSIRSGKLCRVKTTAQCFVPDDDDEADKLKSGNKSRDVSSVLETEQLAASIHSQADILSQSWSKTQSRVEDWQRDVNDIRQRVEDIESQLADGLNFVSALERETISWRQNVGTSLGLTQLQLEYSQIKVY
jgi:chromosome segregation ATPase